MNTQAYTILSKHLAENLRINLQFEENACPSTDGKNITLPKYINEEMASPLIGALLHETAHIRFSVSPKEICRGYQLTESEMHAVNTLEDIRIDAKTLQQYPNAKIFYHKLIEYAIKRHENKISKEPFWVQVLKNMILIASDYSTNIYDKKVVDTAKRLMNYAKIAIDCEDTHEVVRPAKDLLRELLIAEKEQSSKELASTLAEQNKAINQLQSQRDELNKEKDELRRNINKLNQEKEKNQEARTEIFDNLEKTTNKEEKANLDKAIEKSYNFDEEINEQRREEHNNLYKAIEECDNLEKEIRQKEKELQDVLTLKDGKSFSSLEGFKNFSKKDFVSKHCDLSIDNLQELLEEVLIKKADTYINSDYGNKLNSNKLSEYYDEDAELFIDSENRKVQTNIAFVVDASGSMQKRISKENSRRELSLNIVLQLASKLKQAIDNGAPADFSIYAFGSDTINICADTNDFNQETIRQRYCNAYNRISGNTYLERAVNFVNEELKAKNTTDNIAVVITDADVNYTQLDRLVNTTSSDSTKFIYIGIDAKTEYEEVFKLFGNNNITGENKAEDILRDTLMRAL